jgi:hypothetical protein
LNTVVDDLHGPQGRATTHNAAGGLIR